MSSTKLPTFFHIRRCHICDHVNCLESMAINKCSDCGKHLAPFFYFDESRLEGLAEIGPHMSEWNSTPLPPGTYKPIWGLSTYWQEDHEGNDFRN